MKQQIDATLASDDELQRFLTWVNHKSSLVSNEVEASYKPAVLRAYYFELSLPFLHYRNFLVGLLDPKSSMKPHDYGFDKALRLDNALISEFFFTPAYINGRVIDQNDNVAEEDYVHVFDINVCANASDPLLKKFLQDLRDLLPDTITELELRRAWWQANGMAWLQRMVDAINHRYLGYALNSRLLRLFNKQQEESLRQYQEACQLLVDCLNNASDTVRSHIEDTLLLPIAEIREIEKHRGIK
jgi:hypothetical protein